MTIIEKMLSGEMEMREFISCLSDGSVQEDLLSHKERSIPMHEKLQAGLGGVPGGIKTDWGETVWPLTSVTMILDLALRHNWIILGGDVLTMEHKYTYDNWYFNPDLQKPLKTNVEGSIEKTRQYISQYVAAHGADYLFAFSISDQYVGANSGGGLWPPADKRR